MSITNTAPTAVTGMPLASKALISIAAMAAGRGRISAAKVFRRPGAVFEAWNGVNWMGTRASKLMTSTNWDNRERLCHTQFFQITLLPHYQNYLARL